MTRRILPTLVVLAACGGSPAGAQPQANDGISRIHMYEVAHEQGASAVQTMSRVAEPGFIEVSGSGSVVVEADMAFVSFAVETSRTGAADAAGSNADLMDRVFAAVRAANLPGMVIETFGYSLRPDYNRPENNRPAEISGYTASNNIRVTVTDVDAVGRLLDAAIAAGANRVSSLSFGTADTEEAERAALAAAVAHAKAQAEVMAAALGYELGAPVEVHGGGQSRGGPMLEMAQARSFAATPIEAGDQTVRASVTIKFALGPERAPR